MKNKKIIRALFVIPEELDKILDSRRSYLDDTPEDADYCFQMRVSKYAMRSLLQDTTIDCTVLKNGRIHPVACGTPYCANWQADGNCSMIVAQIRELLGPNDIYIKAFDKKELSFQWGWPDAKPPELVFVEEKKNE